MTIPEQLEIDVLGPGTTEAQEGEAWGPSHAESGALLARQMPNVEFNVSQPPAPPPIVEALPEVRPGSAAHDQIQIGSLLDTRLRMLEPLTIEMEKEEEFYIAKCDELNEFGHGTDPISAVQDLRHTISELYWSLKDSQDRLGSDLAATWNRIKELVNEA